MAKLANIFSSGLVATKYSWKNCRLIDLSGGNIYENVVNTVDTITKPKRIIRQATSNVGTMNQMELVLSLEIFK